MVEDLKTLRFHDWREAIQERDRWQEVGGKNS